MQAIIMAGGRGSRLMPLTKNSPKPLVPIIDKPVLEHIISLLVHHGITDIGITLGYLAEKIISYFGTGNRLGANLTYFVETTPLGTAGSIKGTQMFIKDDFLVMSGDAYTDLNLTKFIAFHKSKNSVFTIVCKQVANAVGMGILERGDDGRLLKFEEKPTGARSGLVNCGIYCMSKDILFGIPENTPFDFGKDLIPKLVNKAYAFVTEDYWSDIGTLPSYYYTNYHVATSAKQL